MGQGGLSWLHVKEGHFCQINREGGVPEFGTLHPARDYPSAPSVDFKHDRGNCAVGDVRDMKERVAERTPLNSKGGGGLCLDLATGQNRRGQKFLSTHTQNHTDTHLPFIMYSNMGKPHPCETYCNRNTFESFLNQARYLTRQP